MIRSKLRQRVMRAIYTSLINADLTESELLDVANELRDGYLGADISRLIGSYADQMRSFDRHDPSFRSDDRRLVIAKDLMRRAKITKTNMIKMAKSVGVSGLPAASAVTADEFLGNFFDRATDQEADRFLSMLDRPGSEDPFLEGIMKRNR